MSDTPESTSPESRFTRRHLLMLLGGLGGAGAFAAASARWKPLYRLGGTITTLPYIVPGALSAHVTGTLTAAIGLMLEGIGDMKRYREYLAWYADNVGGYRAAYYELAGALDRAARVAGASDFVTASPNDQRAAVQTVSEQDRRLTGRYDKFFFEPILRLFTATDALVLAGYPGWPGVPMGLDDYTQPLPPREG